MWILGLKRLKYTQSQNNSNEYLLSKTFNVLHVVLIDFVLIARQLI